jgi:hypothetical protein
MMISRYVVAAMLALGPQVVFAQDAMPSDCRHPGDKVVLGQVISDSATTPRAGWSVWIRELECTAAADSAGRFIFTGVPARVLTLTIVNSLWVREPAPVSVDLTSQDTVRPVLQVRAGGYFEDCRDTPPCAALLKRPDDDAPLDEDAATREAFLRTGIALATKYWRNQPGWVVCISGADRSVLPLLRIRHAQVVTDSECEMAQYNGRQRLHHAATRLPAVRIGYRFMSTAEDGSPIGQVTLFVGRLWAETWSCVFEASGNSWEAASCRMIAVS